MPRMPAPNPWLTDSAYPISHMNPAATDAVSFAGPTGGRRLTRDEVPVVPTLFVSNPTVKTIGADTVAFASGALGVQKILATGDAWTLLGEVLYPGMEEPAAQATPATFAAVLAQADAAFRAKDDVGLVAAANAVAGVGFTADTVANGVFNLIDRDGFHYCVYGGVHVVKTTDDNRVEAPPRVVTAAAITRLHGLTMTYDGYLAAAAQHAVVVLDRDLTPKASIAFRGEAVASRICVDEQGGIYVVTSQRMRKVIWNGRTLSDQAPAFDAGARGAGTTPTLMGFGDDPHKFVVIAAADETGTNLVAFWRDEIPAEFEPQPGTTSRRIADQIRIDLSPLTIEPIPAVLGYGVAVLNSRLSHPAGMGPVNAVVSGGRRPAPRGIEKFVWNPGECQFGHAWTNPDIDNTDGVVPSISAATNEIYVAHQADGRYQYLGLDWDTGAVKDRWVFPDDSRIWNAVGGITGILENGDLMLGGLFGSKRLNIGP